MIYSFLYLVSFVMFVAACICYPKTEKLNIVVDGVIGYVMTLCYGALVAFIVQICKLPINIMTVSIAYGLGACFILAIIIKKKKMQKHFCQKQDIVALSIIFLVIARIGIHIFSRRIELNFGAPVDPSVHFLWAMDIVRKGTVSGMFFTQFHNAMFIEMLSPFFTELTIYKPFILADCFHTLMQCYVFYGIVCYMLRNSKHKFLPLLITALYWLGYPLYSYTTGGYIYWTMGGMLVQFVIFILQIYKDNASKRKLCIIPLILGIYGSTICYVQFAPAVFLTVAAVIIYCVYKEKGIVINKKFITVSTGIGVLFLICAAVGYYFIFASRGLTVFEAFSLGSHNSRSLEFIVALPIIYYLIYKAVTEKKMSVYSIAVCCVTVIQLGFTTLAMINLVSSYYLFKYYYIFWSLLWLILVDRRDLFTGKVRKYVVNYLLIAIILLMFMYTPKKEWSTDEALSLDNSMYRYNTVVMKEKDFRENFMDEVVMELFEYAYNLKQETGENVYIVGTNEIKGCATWYQGIVHQPVYWISPLKREFLDEFLSRKNPQYIMVFKHDTGYFDNQAFFDSLEWLFENEKAFIAKVY